MAVAAGARSLHVHPRRADGSETVDAAICDAVVSAIRNSCPGIPVGLTTGAWIEPDLERRLGAIAGWSVLPDFASVNFSEEGAADVCRELLDLGVGIEAGLADVQDVGVFLRSGLADRCLRVLIEVPQEEPAHAVEAAWEMDAMLERAGVDLCLHHGVNLATWAVLRAAVRAGRDIRIGLEDTLCLPDGTPAADNAELVAAAVTIATPAG